MLLHRNLFLHLSKDLKPWSLVETTLSSTCMANTLIQTDTLACIISTGLLRESFYQHCSSWDSFVFCWYFNRTAIGVPLYKYICLWKLCHETGNLGKCKKNCVKNKKCSWTILLPNLVMKCRKIILTEAAKNIFTENCYQILTNYLIF